MIHVVLLSLLVGKTDLWRLFPQEADVTAAPGLVRLPIPEDVLRACRGDLSDIRLFDANNKEIAYVVDSGEMLVEKKESVRLEVKKVSRTAEAREGAATLYHEAFDTTAPPDGEWTLVFDTDASEIVRTLKITGVDKDDVAQPLAAGVSLFRLPHMQAERLSVPITVKGLRRLVISLDGEAAGYMQPRMTAQRRALYGGTDLLRVPLVKTNEIDQGKRTIATFARPVGLVPSALALSTDTPLFDRRVRVLDGEPIGSARLFRITNVDYTELRVGRPHSDALRVEIDNEDSPKLEALAITALVRQPVLAFNAPPGAITLRFGGGRVERPSYDVVSLLQRPSTALPLLSTKLATLSARRANASFNPKPALAFAMRPGAPVDVAHFTHRCVLPLTPSPDGLASVVLPAAIVAVARPDLGDVRIVDKKAQQWPYLAERTPMPEMRPLLLALLHEEHTSKITLRDEFAPMRIDRLELDVSAPYVDRAAKIWSGDRVIKELRLTRKKDEEGPIVIDLEPIAANALTLEVQNGDDAPLAIEDARARHLRKKIFVTAPAGDYVLLTGNADLQAPSYELEAARDTVLAVTASDSEPGTLGKNPDYRVTANLGAGGRGLQIGLWAAIAIAVLVLGALTLRLAKND